MSLSVAMVRATRIDGKGGAHWGRDGEEAGDGAGEAGDAARGGGEGAGDGARSDEEEAGDGASSDGDKACGGTGRRRRGAGDDGLDRGGDDDDERPGGVGGEWERLAKFSQVLPYIPRAMVPVRGTNRDQCPPLVPVGWTNLKTNVTNRKFIIFLKLKAKIIKK